MGDGEVAEGSVWEAFMFAAYNQLSNLVAIIDVNRLGQSDPTMLQHQVDVRNTRSAQILRLPAKLMTRPDPTRPDLFIAMFKCSALLFIRLIGLLVAIQFQLPAIHVLFYRFIDYLSTMTS